MKHQATAGGAVDSAEYYNYDMFNRMISRSATNTPEQFFVYDGQNLLLVLNSKGVVQDRYFNGPAVDQVLASFAAKFGEMGSGLAGASSRAAAAAAECDGVSTSCFPAGTPVATSTGSVLIEAIRQGNEVWAYDLLASQWRTCRVLQTFVHEFEGTSAFITVEGETTRIHVWPSILDCARR